ncbi:hypothetical protein FHW84_004415 [Dyella sp. SG562]|uniref:hypothetical protein n=1 Tax=Dyella TaxID=231454 RepID=UPI00141F0C2D|nr:MULTISPECIES: hypothetical protein [unclassified Dyella]NII75804.1 hypothetical protein [Dyella sp. SG562]NKJ22116.1 hypothetical protein [Dyella sp. SG609]
MNKRKYMVAEPGNRASAPAAAAKPARAGDDGAPPVWHKDNRGFWFVVCVAASLVFALIYSALR